MLKPYEIARNNPQTIYQSKLHTTVQPNSISYLCTLYVWQVISTTHNRRIMFILCFYLSATKKLFCVNIISSVVAHRTLFLCTHTHKNKYDARRVAVYIEIRSTRFYSVNMTCTKNYYLQYCVRKTNNFIVKEMYTVHSKNSMHITQ